MQTNSKYPYARGRENDDHRALGNEANFNVVCDALLKSDDEGENEEKIFLWQFFNCKKYEKEIVSANGK